MEKILCFLFKHKLAYHDGVAWCQRCGDTLEQTDIHFGTRSLRERLEKDFKKAETYFSTETLKGFILGAVFAEQNYRLSGYKAITQETLKEVLEEVADIADEIKGVG